MEQGIVKPKTQRHKRILKARLPKVHENDKKSLFIRGGNTSETVTSVLKDLYALKKPNATLFRKRNITRPFENATSIEFLSKMNDASLFMFGSHSKKRPHNLVIGRTFDSQLLDMIELGVENYQSLESVKGNKCALATKPCLVFAGPEFETDDELRRLQSILTDFFRGPVIKNVRLAGLEHVIQFTANDGRVFLRSYRIALKKSGTRIPRIELENMGPNMDLTVRRTHIASDDLYKKACRKPKAAKPKKVKNVSGDIFGTKRGRIHMTSQDLGNLQTRKVKALKRNLSETKSAKKTIKRLKSS
uniref:Ribosome production factor 2 homolog n=1 Tax=Phallusia mammillata TaxID=59560 RepID=A0A6F9DRE8_9ASCI|nr:ribosome production factor 2 homolog [Phallusia mammillata]